MHNDVKDDIKSLIFNTLDVRMPSRAGSMDNGHGIAVGWLGDPIFRAKEGHELFVFHMPTF